MTTLDIAPIVGTAFPPEAGATLADHILLRVPDWSELTFDATKTPAAMLIGGFYFGFLQRIHDHDPELLALARDIPWFHKHAFQSKNATEWIYGFKPRED